MLRPNHRLRPILHLRLLITVRQHTAPFTHRATLPLLSPKVSNNYHRPRKFPTQPTPPQRLEPHEYHSIADASLEILYEALESLSEERTDVDVEYSAGVLTLVHPKGTYVFNKQPPNQQIWVSSPVSGPARFDWDGDDWVSARDGSRIKELMGGEVGVEVEFEELSSLAQV